MIVRNEAPVIERCLRSALPFIDTWVIVDTGSTDETPRLIVEILGDKPGHLHHRTWKDFGHNRTEALHLAEGIGDYLLFIDADETLYAPASFDWGDLTSPAYYLFAEVGAISYCRVALVEASSKWRWAGVIHEYLSREEPFAPVQLDWPRITVRQDGARSLDPSKFAKDLLTLEAALKVEPDNARYTFYLAHTLRQTGRLSEAKEAYWRRWQMGGFREEAWYSLYQVARLTEKLGAPPPDVQVAHLSAFHHRPSRAEPLFHLARFHANRSEDPLALLFARPAAEMSRPKDVLFVEDEIYRWRALDELCLLAASTGAYALALWAANKLLQEQRAPATEQPRIEKNLARLKNM